MTDYLVWTAHWEDDLCRLGRLENVDKSAEIRWGLSRADGFPSDACFKMDPDFPNDTLLTDCLKNSSGELVVTTRVMEHLQQAGVTDIEYLPVGVFDHKDRPVEEHYVIAHPINPVDCLDLEACQPRWNKIVEGQIRGVRNFVVLPDRIPPQRKLLRCAQYTAPKLVHRELADSIEAAGFTGCEFIELEDYRG